MVLQVESTCSCHENSWVKTQTSVLGWVWDYVASHSLFFQVEGVEEDPSHEQCDEAHRKAVDRPRQRGEPFVVRDPR